MNRQRTIILFILSIVFIGIAYGLYLYQKPVPSIASKKADFVLAPEEILSDFEENETVANAKYLDKIIEVEGKIATIKDSRSIYLVTDNPLSSIIFEMERPIKEDDLEKGDQIVLKGVCSGYLMDVVMTRSVIINNLK